MIGHVTNHTRSARSWSKKLAGRVIDKADPAHLFLYYRKQYYFIKATGATEKANVGCQTRSNNGFINKMAVMNTPNDFIYICK